MRAAVVQMVSGAELQANLDSAEKQIRNAVADGADLVLLPENFALMPLDPEDILDYGEIDGSGPIQDFLANLAASLGVTIAGGSLPLKTADGRRVTNSLLLFDRAGQRIARYDKIHLFDVDLPDGTGHFHESQVIAPGNESVVVDVDGFRLGLSICYDLRFPELYRRLVADGAELLLVPAAFTATTGKAHWHSLLQARAVENLCYVMASNQGGIHANGRATYGHSLVLDPWGKTLGGVGSGSGFFVVDIDRERQHTIRSRFPVLTHSRINDL